MPRRAVYSITAILIFDELFYRAACIVKKNQARR
jgi:hypothetical protein